MRIGGESVEGQSEIIQSFALNFARRKMEEKESGVNAPFRQSHRMALIRSETPLEAAHVENAVASVVSSVVSRESTISMCGLQSIMSALRSAAERLPPSTT